LSAPFDAYKDTYREAVQDSIAFSGLELEFFTERKVSHLLRVARTHLGPPSSLRVADIGCGIGLSDGLLAPQVGELHGVDMARGALATAAHDNPHVHYFIESPAFKQLAAGDEVDIDFDQTTRTVRIEPRRP